jgi:hypothetical protein
MGFVDSEQARPIFVTTKEPAQANELSGLSFLDADLAYRF